MICQKKKPGLFCISFDSVSMSGIIVELLKIAKVFHANNFQIYLDLGYEIKFDKNNFFLPYSNEKNLYQSWIHLIKTISQPFYRYSEQFVSEIFQKVILETRLEKKYEVLIEKYADYIAKKLIDLWTELNIKYVLVENGTLPENVIFTKALYKAIDIYGNNNKLNKYVLWRDHDLMWSSEANINKYGNFPYPNTPKLIPSRFISHIVLHDSDYQKALNWCPNASLSIIRNSFQSDKTINPQNIRNQFRNFYQIPENAFMIARYTRIIPQKRIDRDIQLISHLHQIASSQQNIMTVYLVIAGDPNENFHEYLRLKNLIVELKLENYVIFAGNLKPISFRYDHVNHVANLIVASDLCSFLTSYHYESFGNPIAEAISLGKPYLATTYMRYQHVYGNFGYQGLIFPIDENLDPQVDACYARKVYNLLHNQEKRTLMAENNLHLMKKNGHIDFSLKNYLNDLLDVSLINE